MQKPAGTEAFLAKIAAIRQEVETRQGQYPNAQVYDLQNGELTIKPAVLAQMLENSRTYATTQKQVDEWSRLQSVVQALNEIRQAGGFGSSFNAGLYLKDALVNEGLLYAGADLQANHAYITQQARLR